MIIVIGLGNPGKKFENTRHNIGFMAIDKFAEKNDFPEFKLQKKSDSLISEKDEIMLVKPQTFMNESGGAVKKFTSGENAENLIVVHDDVDLPVGKIKIVKGRGSAGHKGVESIIKNIGNENLVRIRIGIAPKNNIKAEKIVLKNFSKEEKEILDKTIEKSAEFLDFLLKNGLEKTMNEYN